MTYINVYPSYIATKTSTHNKFVGGGNRGDICTFSRQSRLRMIKFLHSIVFDRGLLVTLTYPRDFPIQGKTYHDQLQEFRNITERMFGKTPCIWKLEFQKRGAPHFHLFYIGDVFLPISVLSRVWNSLVAPGDSMHLKIGVDVKRISASDGVRNVGAYISKYVSKEVTKNDLDTVKMTGRYWGHWNIEKTTPTRIVIPAYEVEGVLNILAGGDLIPCAGGYSNNVLNSTIFSAGAGTNDTSDKILAFLAEGGYTEQRGIFN